MNSEHEISEGEALDEWGDCHPHELRHEIIELMRQPTVQNVIRTVTQRMSKAKTAKVGETIECPSCGKGTVKTTYHKVFCSNYKTHGKRNCKDRYHNFIREHCNT